MPTKEELNRIGYFQIEKVNNTNNLATALVTYFKCSQWHPDNDPEGKHGWDVWAEKKCDEAIDLIAQQIKLGSHGPKMADPALKSQCLNKWLESLPPRSIPDAWDAFLAGWEAHRHHETAACSQCFRGEK